MHAKKVALAIAVASAALAFGSQAAFATDTYSCQFSGVVQIAAPGIPALPGGLGDPLGGPVNVFRQATGTYSFGGSGTCAHGDADLGESGNSGVFATSITASGSYLDVDCSIGDVSGVGRVTVTTATAGQSEIPSTGSTFNFGINYVAGQAVVTVTRFTTTQNTSGLAGGAGYATVVPLQGNCVTSNVSAFEVAGAFQVNA